MAVSLRDLVKNKRDTISSDIKLEKSRPWEDLKGPNTRTIQALEAVKNAKNLAKSIDDGNISMIVKNISYSVITLDSNPILQQTGIKPQGLSGLIKAILNF